MHFRFQSTRFCASIFVVLTLSLALETTASAASWKKYFVNRAGVSFSIDTSSIARFDRYMVRAWERQEWAAPDTSGNRGFFWLIESDCLRRTYVYRDIEPIVGTIPNTKSAAAMTEIYVGINYFQPTELDEARYAVLCGKGSPTNDR